MSKLARQIAEVAPAQVRTRPGPPNQCLGVYDPDLEDATAIDKFRRREGQSWATAQVMFDSLAGITRNIRNDRFRYHWNLRCSCWPDDMRRK